MMAPRDEDFVTIRVTITVEPDDDMFFGTCEEFPGVLVNGTTAMECLTRTKEAIQEHLETFIPRGMKVPKKAIIHNTSAPGRLKTKSFVEDIPVPSFAA